ncbi:hypothetical protein [Robertmurraya sp. FSL R5-0851]|uniref:hypothetical protein n=1 Tax=Robertmurraya sp. FSL R5-0851 TaxID=2921584 RepID=UPI0030FBF7A2
MKKKKRSIRFLVCLLVVSLLFNVSLPVFAEEGSTTLPLENKDISKEEKQVLKDAIDNPVYVNEKRLSKKNRDIVKKFTKNPDEYLVEATIINDQPVLLYNTSDVDVKIANTDGIVEVIERKNENTFTINDVTHTLNYEEVSEELNTSSSSLEGTTMAASSGWVAGSNPGGTWYVNTTSWHNVHASNAFGSYTVGALATLISYFVNPLVGVVTGIASILIGSMYSNTSVAKVYKTTYTHQYPIYRRDHFQVYAVYNGNNIFLGTENKYYYRSFG